ncbi:N-acetyltransferase [Cyanobium sp. ATX 6A2]|uniref:GNAT family N-acetyltransferase n=1 Tax=Cyanobium sp. ATX 6A2 TaxID=2823700 RepID=UPI0028F4295E|nr:N-acetyltransferase [Cyanobium sp. ATX 6A2]
MTSWQRGMMEIRIANQADRDDVRSIYLSAFPEGERNLISDLAVDLLTQRTTPVTLSLVAESGGDAVGHVAFSPVAFRNSEDVHGHILAPLAVEPTHQKTGIGSALVEDGIRKLSEMGTSIFFVYGDPKYYGRFGFSGDVAKPFKPPYDLQYPFGWQAITLDEALAKKCLGPISCVPALCNPKLW